MARKSSVERAIEATGGFKTAQKNIVVQYDNRDRKTEDILQEIRQDVLSKGFKEADFSKIDVYIKPQENKVFYVVNGELSGSINF
nr:DUF6465 family protein [uncultured Butyrivibrio sp.]